ncbi:hypothetical protein A3A46_04460 [Candidatus Roizmanbacteria bacterium RIFCSPLOWO2_01_FULL_37_13]|nr:MAG: hypothetical protein A3A46_04460 [Candidatus Roizmanbacteria bacterium RIFCSPLOWO2_01_FULL_37_13]
MAMDRKRFNLVTDVDGVFVYAPIPIKTTAALLSRRFKMPEISIFDTFPTYPIALLGGAHTFRAELSRRRHEGRKPKPESVKGYNEFTLKADRHKVELSGAVVSGREPHLLELTQQVVAEAGLTGLFTDFYLNPGLSSALSKPFNILNNLPNFPKDVPIIALEDEV